MICVIYPMNSSLNINRVPWILEETLSNLTSYVSCKILKEMILFDDLQPHFYRELTQVPALLNTHKILNPYLRILEKKSSQNSKNRFLENE